MYMIGCGRAYDGNGIGGRCVHGVCMMVGRCVHDGRCVCA